jgi:hypothetical protein
VRIAELETREYLILGASRGGAEFQRHLISKKRYWYGKVFGTTLRRIRSSKLLRRK